MADKLPQCGCGCGQRVKNKGSKFRQGHDAKLHSKLLAKPLTAATKKQLQSHGWKVPKK